MINKPKKYIHRFIAILLCVSIITSTLSACARTDDIVSTNVRDNSSIEINTTEIAREITAEIRNDMLLNQNNMLLSDNWSDYVGDCETFVYGLIKNQLSFIYDVFDGYVELSNGTVISGIAYADYNECYADKKEDNCCFTAGFIPYCDELNIPEDEYKQGLIITNLDYQDDNTIFVMNCKSEAFSEHCVVYNQYVKYGVNSVGNIYYENADYSKEICDESLGSLYSYDEKKYLYDDQFGDYINISGVSLYEQIDFAAIEKEMNNILAQQDINFEDYDIQSNVYFAQSAVINYMLSLQEETFLGYNVDAIVEAAKALDPMECFRITDEGLEIQSLDKYRTSSENVARWLVGAVAVVSVAVGIVGSIVFIECPALSALSCAVLEAGMEVFIQVVVENQDLKDINWNKVAVAAVSGAVSGLLGPYLATTGKLSFVGDFLLDGLSEAIEQGANEWIEGKSGEEILSSMGQAFMISLALNAGFKAVGKIAGKITKKMQPVIRSCTNKFGTKLKKTVISEVNKVSKQLYSYKLVADSSVFHSKYISKKIAQKQVSNIIKEGSNELLEKSLSKLKNQDIFDINGNLILKDELLDKIHDGSIIGYYIKDGEKINIKSKNGMLGIVFDEKYQNVKLSYGLTGNRQNNFDEAAKLFKQHWIDNPNDIPDTIATAITNKGKVIDDIMPKELLNIITKRENGWVLHENIDLETITLVPRALHDATEGGITHMGGVGLSKYLKSHMGREFFERFVSGAEGVLINLEVDEYEERNEE